MNTKDTKKKYLLFYYLSGLSDLRGNILIFINGADMEHSDLLYKDETYAIIGAAIEAHRELGNGFLENVYEEALGIEFTSRKIPYQMQARLPVYYKGHLLKKEFIADFIVHDKIILELKGIPRLSATEEAQIINYLKATGLQLGLLINFGSSSKLEWKRFIRTQDQPL